MRRHLSFTSRLSLVEVASAIERKYRDKEISAETREAAVVNLTDGIDPIQLVELGAETVSLAQGLLARYPLRAGDATQLASALLVRNQLKTPMRFAGFDSRLNKAADAEGFEIIL